MADSLIGASFSDYVQKQINLRQEKLNLNYVRDDRWNLWQNANTAFVRLSSGIDINKDQGASAKKYQLFNTKFDNKLASGTGLGGNTAYGWEADSTTGFGYAVPPGITSMNVKAQNRGSLREANIDILCSNKGQFEIISKLYLRLGYSMLLEWGWSYYYDNDGVFYENFGQIANPTTSTFFFNPKQTPQGILNQINKSRLDSCGNYDAIIGVVSNYNWNMEKDGSYKITLTLKTWGDITESLKSNTSTGSDVVTANTGSSDLEKSANKSDLHKILYFIANDLFKNNKSSIPEINHSFIQSGTGIKATQFNPPDQNQDEAIQLDFPNLTGTGQGSKHQYITLKALLRIMQNFTLMYNTSATNKEALVDLDWKMTDSFCLALRKTQYPLDPRVCITDFYKSIGGKPALPKGAKYPTSGAEDNIYNKVYNSIFHVGKWNNGLYFGANTDYIGRTGYIWVNINHIAKVLDSYIIRETGAISVYDFLQNLMKDIQSSLGNINNFEVIYDEDKNIIRIIDSTYIPGIADAFPSLFSDLSVFTVNTLDSAKGSFLRDAKIQSKLSNAFASQTTIGAQANGDVVGADATMLSKFNNGLEDRLVKTKSNANMDDKTKLLNKYRVTRINYELELNYGAISDDFINSNKQTMIDYYRYKLNSDVKNGNIEPTGFLPIDLEITMDGLSGIKIYENYMVDDIMLPKDYQDNVKFITTGVSHTVQGNDWTTTLNSVMSPIGRKQAAPNSTGVGTQTGTQQPQSSTQLSQSPTSSAVTSPSLAPPAPAPSQPTVPPPIQPQAVIQPSSNTGVNKCGKYDFSAEKDNRGKAVYSLNGTNPYPLTNYKKSNILLLDEKLTKYGFKSVESKIALLSVVGKESQFEPIFEQGKFSRAGLLSTFPSYFKETNPKVYAPVDDYVTDKPNARQQGINVNNTVEHLLSYVYYYYADNNGYLQSGRGGNQTLQEGYKFRGRGFYQTTFRDGYKRSQDLLQQHMIEKGLPTDLLNNPDALVNNPEVAAILTAIYFIKDNPKQLNKGYAELMKNPKVSTEASGDKQYTEGTDIYNLVWTFARYTNGWGNGWTGKYGADAQRQRAFSLTQFLIELYETDSTLQQRNSNWKYCSN